MAICLTASVSLSLTEVREVSLDDATTILGVSRPLEAHRMDSGDRPFSLRRQRSRATLRDVLALKTNSDFQRGAGAALAKDAEDLKQRHGMKAFGRRFDACFLCPFHRPGEVV